MLIETFVVGLVASIVGVLFGILLAPGLAAILKAAGIDLGATGIVITSATVITGIVVGLVATMVSGFVPALRATRVEPVTAMRDSRHARHRPAAHVAGRRLAGADGARPARRCSGACSADFDQRVGAPPRCSASARC